MRKNRLTFSTATLFACLFALNVAHEGFAAFKFEALPAAPKEAEIGEVIFTRSDYHSNNSEQVTMPREEFLRFFSAGVFHNTGETNERVYRSGEFVQPHNEKGGILYCSGAFATKTGQVFIFTRPRERVLEIEDVQHRTGWLIIEEKKPDAVQPGPPEKKSAP
jgi:hypothetical protein